MLTEGQKAEIVRMRAEDAAKWKRVDELVARHGVDGMTEEEMRQNLVTCDFRGCEVKAIILDRMLSKACERAFEAGMEAGS